MRRSDLALYRAKERGKNAACLFEFEFEREHLGRIRLQAELSSALDDGQVFLAPADRRCLHRRDRPSRRWYAGAIRPAGF